MSQIPITQVIYKYDDLIKSQKISISCPDKQKCQPVETKAFHWCHDPINSEYNFLPNHLYEKARSHPPRANTLDDLRKCSRCAVSFFTSETAARNKFNGFTKAIREKLGYTHVAEGDITQSDGVASLPSQSGHFELFEYTKCDLKDRFTIIGPL